MISVLLYRTVLDGYTMNDRYYRSDNDNNLSTMANSTGTCTVCVGVESWKRLGEIEIQGT